MTAATTTAAVTVETGELTERLTAAARVAGTGHAGQLHGVRFICAGGKLALEAGGADIAMRTVVAHGGEGDFSFCLAAKTALAVVRSLDGLQATFELGDDGMIHVSSGAVRCALNRLDERNVPPMPKVEWPEAGALQFDINDLRVGIEKVERMVARGGESRVVLTGAFIRLDGDTLTMTGTDAVRIVTLRHTLPQDTARSFEAIVPHSGLAELVQLVDAVDLDVDDSRLVAYDGTTTIVSRLIGGAFPPVGQILEQPLPLEVRVPAADLKAALRRMGVARAPGKDFVVSLRFAAGELVVSASSDLVGAMSESIPVAWDHEELEILFALDVLRSGIDLFQGDAAVLHIGGPLKALRVIEEANEEAGVHGFTFLAMPRKAQ